MTKILKKVETLSKREFFKLKIWILIYFLTVFAILKVVIVGIFLNGISCMKLKKINLCILLSLSLSVQSAQPGQMSNDQLYEHGMNKALMSLPGPAYQFEGVPRTLGGGCAVFIGTYLLLKSSEAWEYFYFGREAKLQQEDPTINHDVINKLKKMCLDNGVKINHIFYSPLHPIVSSIRGGSGVIKSLFGNILLLGRGYGASKNEKDIIPLTVEEVQFIIGHECVHPLNNDANKRYLAESALSTGIILSQSTKTKELLLMLALTKVFGFPKLMRDQEYNADYYASNDPKVIQQGIDLWQSIDDKEQYLDIFSRIRLKIIHALFCTHPPFGDRVKNLKIRLKELQQEQSNSAELKRA